MPMRTTQDGTNSAANCQEKISAHFAELSDNFKVQIDYFIIISTDEETLLNILSRFSKICRERNLTFSLLQSELLLKEANSYGRIIDRKGVKLNPNNRSGLKDSDTPRNAAKLCQYVHDVNWISIIIPRFSERVTPLREFLEVAYVKSGGIKKRNQSPSFKSQNWDGIQSTTPLIRYI